MSKLSEIVSFNPTRTLKKGTVTSFIEMASLPINARYVEKIEQKEFTGSGTKFKNGDVLFARITPCLENGKTAQIFELKDDEIAFGSTEFIVMSAKEPEFDQDYLYYFSQLPEFREYAKSRMEGTSGRQRVSWQSLSEFEFDFPDKEIRKSVGDFLSVFDQKIQLNTQINQTLEQIAQAIFKSWFIDFDPVRAKSTAKAEGATDDQANQAAMSIISGKSPAELTAYRQSNPTDYEKLAQLVQQFPSEFEVIDGVEVPKGWGRVSIADKNVLEIIKPKINSFQGEKEYIATANVSGNSIAGDLEWISYENRPSRANMQPIANSIWFAKMVGEHKAILIDENDKFLIEETILSTGFMGLKPKKNKKCFLYCYINSEFFFNEKNQLATGAVQIALNNGSFSKIEITLPSDEILEKFEQKLEKIFSMISESQKENKILSKARDLLLPKLLNGEV